MLIDDFYQFKLRVYFWDVHSSYDSSMPLLEPEYPTSWDDLIGYARSHNEAANYWLFGKLSTQEFKAWLQDKGIASTFFETTASPSETPDVTEQAKPSYLQKGITQKKRILEFLKSLGHDPKDLKYGISQKKTEPFSLQKSPLTRLGTD